MYAYVWMHLLYRTFYNKDKNIYCSKRVKSKEFIRELRKEASCWHPLEKLCQ